MIVEEITFDSLLAVSTIGEPSPIHRYKGKFFGLASIGKTTCLMYSEEGPEEPFVEYDFRTREWRPVDPKIDEFTGDPNSAVIPIIDVKNLKGEASKKIREALGHPPLP